MTITAAAQRLFGYIAANGAKAGHVELDLILQLVRQSPDEVEAALNELIIKKYIRLDNSQQFIYLVRSTS